MLRFVGLGVVVLLCTSCGDRSGTGDQSPPPTANRLGDGQRLRQIQDPKGDNVNKDVDATAVAVLAVDHHDETGDGKARGTVYVQDLGSTDPLSGISLFDPIPVPASLRLAPGDVIDLRGRYVEVSQLGSFKFPQGFLPQLERPQMRFRYEGEVPPPKEIDIEDLEEFARGRKWIGMLVTVKDVVAVSAVQSEGSGRAWVTLAKSLPGTGLSTAPTITNELIPLAKGSVTIGTKFESITGVVTFFANLHIAPRSPADVVKASVAAGQ